MGTRTTPFSARSGEVGDETGTSSAPLCSWCGPILVDPPTGEVRGRTGLDPDPVTRVDLAPRDRLLLVLREAL